MSPRIDLTPANTSCRAIVPPGGACGAPVTHVVVFGDGDRSRVCHECALRLEQVAQSHGSRIRIEACADQVHNGR